jgi:hypothetical protein
LDHELLDIIVCFVSQFELIIYFSKLFFPMLYLLLQGHV